jgi:hypothetical protein
MKPKGAFVSLNCFVGKLLPDRFQAIFDLSNVLQSSAFIFPPGGFQCSNEASATALKRSADNCRVNLHRLFAFQALPGIMASLGQKCRQLAVEECFKMTGTIWFDPTQQDLNPELFEKIQIAEVQWINGERRPAEVDDFRSLGPLSIAALPSDLPKDAVNTFLSSLIIQSWTVFESLAEDLWIDALNSHPSTLASLSGKARGKYLNRAVPNKGMKESGNGKMLPIAELEKLGFDCSKSMGNILSGKQSFRSLPGIREAYHSAFKEPGGNKIVDILDDDGLQCAAAVRNVLIHKGGKVDKEYLEQVAQVNDAIKPQPNEMLPITGRMTEWVCESCLTACTELYSAVEKWISL